VFDFSAAVIPLRHADLYERVIVFVEFPTDRDITLQYFPTRLQQNIQPAGAANRLNSRPEVFRAAPWSMCAEVKQFRDEPLLEI
jgi:hypothetical protein